MWPELSPQMTRSMAMSEVMRPEPTLQVTRSMTMCEVEHVARTVTTSDKVYGNV